MNIEPYIELDWEHPFDPLYGSMIELPANVILWRGYDSAYPVISDRTAYYSSKDVASGYVKQTPTHKLGTFMTTRTLKILDYRFMRILLTRIINMYRYDTYINDFAPLMISFGLCSLRHQIIVSKQYFKESMNSASNNVYMGIRNMERVYNEKDILEQSGIRIAETTNDAITMVFLKELFRGYFDGFFSPRLVSPFHVEKGEQMSPELILFSPVDTDIIQLDSYPQSINLQRPYGTKTISGVVLKQFVDFMKDKNQLYNIELSKVSTAWKRPTEMQSRHSRDTIKLKWYRKGGKRNKIKKIERRCPVESGIYWRQKVRIVQPEAPVPHVKVSPFVQTLSNNDNHTMVIHTYPYEMGV